MTLLRIGGVARMSAFNKKRLKALNEYFKFINMNTNYNYNYNYIII